MTDILCPRSHYKAHLPIETKTLSHDQYNANELAFTRVGTRSTGVLFLSNLESLRTENDFIGAVGWACENCVGVVCGVGIRALAIVFEHLGACRGAVYIWSVHIVAAITRVSGLAVG